MMSVSSFLEKVIDEKCSGEVELVDNGILLRAVAAKQLSGIVRMQIAADESVSVLRGHTAPVLTKPFRLRELSTYRVLSQVVFKESIDLSKVSLEGRGTEDFEREGGLILSCYLLDRTVCLTMFLTRPFEIDYNCPIALLKIKIKGVKNEADSESKPPKSKRSQSTAKGNKKPRNSSKE